VQEWYRVGLEHITIGRKKIAALLQDLENIAEAEHSLHCGAMALASFFMLQLRNHSMERGFVVADADLSPLRRLVGQKVRVWQPIVS